MEPSPSQSVNTTVHTILDSPNFRTELENVVSNVGASEITQHRLRNISSTITTSTSAINGRTPPVRSVREDPRTGILSAKLKSEATAQKRIKRVSFREDWNYEEVIQQIKIHLKVHFSLQGTQKYISENRIISFWRDYLQRCEDMEISVTLANILSFVTGANREPPLGFPTSPIIIFIHEKDSKYPKANTCSLTLYLPVGETDFDNFVADMDCAIINGGSSFGVM
ncbi:hypothetical protein CBL_09997 [Carabus blaptoides fortunei]